MTITPLLLLLLPPPPLPTGMDVPGFIATWLFYRNWHDMIEEGGWSSVFHLFFLANVTALICLVAYLLLDLRSPTTVFYSSR